VTAGHANWQAILDRHGVDFLLVDTGPYHGRLAPLVREATDRWREVYAGPGMGLYARRPMPAR
jgi:hypothetical protein